MFENGSFIITCVNFKNHLNYQLKAWFIYSFYLALMITLWPDKKLSRPIEITYSEVKSYPIDILNKYWVYRMTRVILISIIFLSEQMNLNKLIKNNDFCVNNKPPIIQLSVRNINCCIIPLICKQKKKIIYIGTFGNCVVVETIVNSSRSLN